MGDLNELRGRIRAAILADEAQTIARLTADAALSEADRAAIGQRALSLVEKVRAALATEEYQIRRTEVVGPSVSGELALHSTIAVLVAMGAILIYVWFRFEWQFAIAAITSPSSAGGIGSSGRRWLGGTGMSMRCADRIAITLVPSNGTRPVSISYSIAPSA